MKYLHLGLLALNFTILNAMQESEPERMFGMNKEYLGSLIDTHFKVLPNSDLFLNDLKILCLCERKDYSLYYFISAIYFWNLVIFSRAGLPLSRPEWDTQYQECMNQVLKVVFPQMKAFYCDPLLTKQEKHNCKAELRVLSIPLLDSNQWSSLAYLLDMGIKSCRFLPTLMDTMKDLKNSDLKQYKPALMIGCRFLNSLKTLPEYENKRHLKQKLTDEEWRQKKKFLLDREQSWFVKSISCWLPEIMGLFIIRDLPARANQSKDNDLPNKMRAEDARLNQLDSFKLQASTCLKTVDALHASQELCAMPKTVRHYHTIIPTEILSELNKFYIHAVAFDGSPVYSS